MKKNNKGFTLVEILAVIVILGIIMTVALPTYSSIYNSIRLTTYLNNIKTIKNAALDYGNNSAIKDSVKHLHDNTGTDHSSKDWCKVISITNLIEAGYLASDDDHFTQITDVFTGSAMGYNAQHKYKSSSPQDGVALCYCNDKLDIDAFVIKDLDVNQVYHAGEYVRNYVNDDTTNDSDTVYEFRELKVSFIYNELFVKISKAKSNTKVSIEGIDIPVGNVLSSVSGGFFINNPEAVNKVNELIMKYLTNNPTCKHS